MAEIIRICENGMRATDTIYKTLSVKDAIKQITTTNRNYEKIRNSNEEDRQVRVYLDLDLNYEAYKISSKKYEILKSGYEATLIKFARENNFLLCTSSKHASRKISFRLFSLKHSTLYSNAYLVAKDFFDKIDLTHYNEIAKGLFEGKKQLDCDKSVYKNGQKMRMLRSVKDDDINRPLIFSELYREDEQASLRIEDTFILNVDGLTIIEPNVPQISMPETLKDTNAIIPNYPTTLPESYNIEALQDLVNRLGGYNDFPEWNEVGFHLKTFEGMDTKEFEIFDCWVGYSKKSKKHTNKECRERWAGYPTDCPARGWYGLRALLKNVKVEWDEWSAKYEEIKVSFKEIYEELSKQEIPTEPFDYVDCLEIHMKEKSRKSDWNEDNIHESEVFKYFTKYHFYISNEKMLYRLHNDGFEMLEDIHFMEAIRYRNGKHTTEFTRLYMKSVHKRQYTRLIFQLNKKALRRDEYNLFTGFKYDKPISCEVRNNVPQDEGLFKFFEHIDFICQDKQASEYIHNWMAHIIQKPETKTKVALYMYSELEGVGKNIILDIFGKILSGYTAQFTNTEDIAGRFNTNMYNKLFVVGDEINGRASGLMSSIKDIITRLTENIEAKGKNKFQAPDYKNYALTTNNENSIPICSKRRIMAIRCPEEKRSEAEYKRLFEILDNEDTLRAITYYLRNRDISLFLPSNIYATEYLLSLMRNNVKPTIRYFMKNYEELYDKQFLVDDLYNNVISWCRHNSLVSTCKDDTFAKDMIKYFKEYKTKDESRHVCYSFKNKHPNKSDFLENIKRLIDAQLDE